MRIWAGNGGIRRRRWSLEDDPSIFSFFFFLLGSFLFFFSFFLGTCTHLGVYAYVYYVYSYVYMYIFIYVYVYLCIDIYNQRYIGVALDWSLEREGVFVVDYGTQGVFLSYPLPLYLF